MIGLFRCNSYTDATMSLVDQHKRPSYVACIHPIATSAPFPQPIFRNVIHLHTACHVLRVSIDSCLGDAALPRRVVWAIRPLRNSGCAHVVSQTLTCAENTYRHICALCRTCRVVLSMTAATPSHMAGGRPVSEVMRSTYMVRAFDGAK